MRATAWLDYETLLPSDEEAPHITIYRPGESQNPSYAHNGALFVYGPLVKSTDADCTADYVAAVQALCELEPRIAQGHAYEMSIG